MKRIRITPAVRISMGLTLFVMTVLMGLELVGVFPDPRKALLDSRKKTCESLAVYASMAIQKGELNAIAQTMEVLEKRNADILSAALRRGDGTILAQAGDHQQHWQNTRDKLSTLNNVQVPIFKGAVQWGTFELRFDAKNENFIRRLLKQPIVITIAWVVPLAFVGFLLLMKKTLRHLDPTAVVPERVKLALDSLVEGVVLMDHKERIVLANKAFEDTIGNGETSIVGRKVSELEWMQPQSGKPAHEFPWQQAIRDGVSQAAISLARQQEDNQTRTFMVNGAPIIDAAGETRGALATFDDVTHIEAQNTRLQKMLDALKKSRNEVRRQNRALQVLAVQDPLTGCLNRRAFFERFEEEFNRSRRYGHEMACIMVDIDYFKSVNDLHGHPTGDRVLQEVSHLLRVCLRECDVVCRYGGEEFCLLLPETSSLKALKTAERIRRTIGAETMSGVKITISLGISALEFQAGNPTELLSQADKALYEAKNSGRNKSILFNELSESLPKGASGELEPQSLGKQQGDAYIPHHVVRALMLALEHRDIRTAEHCRKVGDLCAAAGRGLMSIHQCAVLEIAGMMHDIGKLGVPDSILLKPGPLNEEEWQIMQDHERRSIDVISSTFLSSELVEIAKYHSHWFDGSKAKGQGQPKGKKIPLGARILHIADAFDAMVSHRPYRPARSYEKAYEELRRCAGTQFDPELVEHFIAVVQDSDDSRREASDGVSNPIKLEIGCEVETLLIAVNTASWNDLIVSAEHLANLALKYGLEHIETAARGLKEAAQQDRGQMEIMKLASKLLGVCGPLTGIHLQPDEEKDKTLAA